MLLDQKNHELLKQIIHTQQCQGDILNLLAQKLLVDDPAIADAVRRMKQSGAAVQALLDATK